VPRLAALGAERAGAHAEPVAHRLRPRQLMLLRLESSWFPRHEALVFDALERAATIRRRCRNRVAPLESKQFTPAADLRYKLHRPQGAIRRVRRRLDRVSTAACPRTRTQPSRFAVGRRISGFREECATCGLLERRCIIAWVRTPSLASRPEFES